MHLQRRGFTPIELMLSIVALPILIAILLPALAKARNAAKETQSLSNLRQLTAAAFTYATEWRDRQFQATPDDLTSHGGSLEEALRNYQAVNNEPLTLPLGWTEDDLFVLEITPARNASIAMPMTFDAEPFGYARIPNARGLSQYLNFRFYDPLYYAPKDTAVMRCVEPLFDEPGEFIDPDEAGGIFWSSYCMSPAGLFDPQVLAGPSQGGFVDPFTIDAALRAPAMWHIEFPDLKTHFMEHHWLQNNRAGECNPAFDEGTYKGCEPYYFNASLESQPHAAFYDGHVQRMNSADIHAADQRLRDAGRDGLWLQQPGGAVNGYYEDTAHEPVQMSYHIYTRDGIKGRDILPR